MSAAKELFLSYGREAEVVEFVKKLKRDLEADGFGVWLDQNDIPAGCDWHAAIGSGLDQCRALLAVVTPKYVTSRYCTSELYTADGDSKLIFPIFYADTDLSSSERARGVKYVISGINWTMFRPNVDDYDMSLEKLKFGMRQHGLGSEAPAQENAASAPAPGSVDTSLTRAIDQLNLSAAPQTPTTPASTSRTEPIMEEKPPREGPGALTTRPSAPEGNTGVDDTDAPPNYESSLFLPSPSASTSTSAPPYQHYPQQHPYPYPSPGQSPWHAPGQPGAYPGQGHPSQMGMPQPYPYPPPPGQGHPSPYMPHAHPQASPYTTPTHPAHQPHAFSPGMMSSPYRTPPPPGPTTFSAGQKVEAMDRTMNKVRVATIQELNANGQVHIHFDGWDNSMDYWCDRSSTELHPVGWAAACRVLLEPPKGIAATDFNWFAYLSTMQAQAAPHHLFSETQRNITQTQPPTPSQTSTPRSTPQDSSSSMFGSAPPASFTKRMAMEVEDKDAPGTMYIGTVLDVDSANKKVHIHWEGWAASWDFWTPMDSPDLHPPGWCVSVGRTLQKPSGQTFTDWPSYVAQYGFVAAPDYLFTSVQRGPPSSKVSSGRPDLKNADQEVLGFRPGMAVEVDDPASPSLTYLCSIVDVDPPGKRLKVHYENWSASWDFWLGVHSTGMHYMGWCERHGRTLRLHDAAPNWKQYCNDNGLIPTTEDMFAFVGRTSPQMACSSQQWAQGLALEIDDPNAPGSTYLGSVVEINPGGHQIKVTYVGWASHWDFWVDVLSSTGIHPIGWCQANNKSLILPGNSGVGMHAYLSTVGLTAAPADLFTDGQKSGMAASNKPATSISGLRPQMRLEAVDRKHPQLICVAHIKRIDTAQGTIEICFDGWTDFYNYTCSPHDADLHPVGWCAANQKSLNPPKGLPFSSWQGYLKQYNYTPMPQSAFTAAQCSGMTAGSQIPGTPAASSSVKANPGFRQGMRLEAKDKMNPSLICVASIAQVNESEGRIEIYFDGWETNYNYWCSYDEPDLHPVGWCAQTNHALQPPRGLAFSSWDNYLLQNRYTAVPFGVFTSSQAAGMKPQQRFSTGMKLEARDRLNPHMMCVATVAQVDGSRLLIHFDGWTSKYDYWCTPDTEDIHPIGWCQRHGVPLQPPKGRPRDSFDWKSYLQEQNAQAAPKSLFWPEHSTTIGCFMAGMKLEAVDRKHPSMICVATIRRVSEGNLFIHFDGWSDDYDYTCQRSSPDIHPMGWCNRNGKQLQPPKGHSGVFIWSDYLDAENSRAVPDHLFTEHQRSASVTLFKPGMRLEAKDRKNPSMTCAATVKEVRDDGKRLLISFDGWTDKYDYWCENTSADIHPVGWCALHGVSLHAPKGMSSSTFQWNSYLKERDAVAAPQSCFSAASMNRA